MPFAAVRRRPAVPSGSAAFDPPEPTRYGEVPWLEPIPDLLIEGALDVPLGPEARYEQLPSRECAESDDKAQHSNPVVKETFVC